MSLTLSSLSTAISVYQLAILLSLLRYTIDRVYIIYGYTQLPRDGHTSFTCNDQFAVTPTFRRRPRNAGNSDQTFPFPGTSGRARLVWHSHTPHVKNGVCLASPCCARAMLRDVESKATDEYARTPCILGRICIICGG